ncbi:TIGR02587 family membrane protein [Kallotenue papyrolyticum]|uniref:TIGR02587 family membrane protein n=1 Tax=Kallotenue papyrolyticum TaxID=1325125 RepID=UPI000492C8EC|nr:TIGR02587 family membrane protein [Kallotenue papyrolyticum]
MSHRQTTRHTWHHELDDLVRGASGGFLFGIPLLYTMEVWWIGSHASPLRLLLALTLTFGLVLALNRTAGFRRTQDIRLRDAAMDSVEALAIGLVCTALVLTLLREITPATPRDETLGKIIFESVPFALGVALANQFLSGSREGDDATAAQPPAPTRNRQLNATLADIGATLIGATIIAFNIAPTDEVPMLAAASSAPWLLALMAASLLISYGIVFEAGFTRQQQRFQQQGIFQRPLSETVAAYLASLLAALGMLLFFGQLSFDDPWQLWLRYTLILGLPATIGGAAGRLAV